MHSTKAYLRAIIAIPFTLFALLIIGGFFHVRALGATPTGGITIVFIMFLGFNVYGAVSSLHKRVSDLESRNAGTKSQAPTTEK